MKECDDIHGACSARKDGDTRGGFFRAVIAATVFRHGEAGIRHLARSCLATKLGHEFVDLSKPGSADWVSL
jgi:hypothetical protein